MRICLVSHGYPPELLGGTEKAVQGLARGLARRGHEVVVVAGTMEHEEGFRTSEAVDRDPESGASVRVHRIHRGDLYYDHWQKSASGRVGEAFDALLRDVRPDLVHVHHWIRLTRDLVAHAARDGIPAVVTLHDLWSTCLLAFRILPGTREFCEARLGPEPCIACAASVPPHTPWMPAESLRLAFARHREDLVRELELARAVVVPSRAHAETVGRFLGVDVGRLALRVVPHGRELALRPGEPLPPPEEHGRLVLGSWSHVHPLKGTDLLLEALARLDPAKAELHLAGGEPDEEFAERVRARAEELPVTFHGPFDTDDLGAHPVTRVHAMVSATRAHESWGLVVDEAAALRLPMVLPRAGAFPERLAEASGALFYAPRDPTSLAEALRRLAEEPGLVGGLRRALPPLGELVPDVERHLDALLEVYGEARTRGAPPPPPREWWRAKMLTREEEAWDASLARCTAQELGLE